MEKNEKRRPKDILLDFLTEQLFKAERHPETVDMQQLMAFYLNTRKKVPGAVRCLLEVKFDEAQNCYIITQVMLDADNQPVRQRPGEVWGQRLYAKRLEDDVHEYLKGETSRVMDLGN